MSISLKKQIKKNGFIVYSISGFSMYPLIKEGDEKVVIQKEKDYKLFDVVLFQRRKNTYVLHRIIDICNEIYIVIGDNSQHLDYLKKENIIGKLTAIIRKGKTINLDTNHNNDSLLSCPYIIESNRLRLLKEKEAYFVARKKEAYYELIRLLIFGKYKESKITQLTQNELIQLCNLLVEKKAIHLLGFAIDKYQLKIDKEISVFAIREYSKCLLRISKFDYAINCISKVLADNKIKHIFLKGSEIKDRYMFPYLRVSNDIDIYVDFEDFHLVNQLLINSFSGETKGNTNHDKEIILNDLSVLIEVHHTLNSNLPIDLSYLLEKPFENATCNFGEYRYHLCSNYETLFFLSHNAKHLNMGDFWFTGISDFYYLYSSFNDELFKEARLLQFCEHYSNVVNRIINDEQLNELDSRFEDILLMEKMDFDLSVEIGRENKFKYLMSRIFPSPNALSKNYCVLVKCPMLYPFINLFRFVKITFRTSVRGKKEAKLFGASSKSLVETLFDVGLSEYIVNPRKNPTRF